MQAMQWTESTGRTGMRGHHSNGFARLPAHLCVGHSLVHLRPVLLSVGPGHGRGQAVLPPRLPLHLQTPVHPQATLLSKLWLTNSQANYVYLHVGCIRNSCHYKLSSQQDPSLARIVNHLHCRMSALSTDAQDGLLIAVWDSNDGPVRFSSQAAACWTALGPQGE